jgi:magnesium-transporting ATPase (P-type)
MSVEPHWLSTREWWKAVGVGVATAAIVAVLNVIALKTQVSPLPKPLGLAFAEVVFGRSLPHPVGLLFHLAWVTFFSVVYVILWRNALTLRNAIILASVLWLLVLFLFFPIVGWGFFGLAVSPKLILPATVSHLLFALILWSLCRLAFGQSLERGHSQPQQRMA